MSEQCQTCNGSGMPNGVSGYPCPECSPEAVKRREELNDLRAEVIGTARHCPRCYGGMAHYRLKGWVCPRCG